MFEKMSLGQMSLGQFKILMALKELQFSDDVAILIAKNCTLLGEGECPIRRYHEFNGIYFKRGETLHFIGRFHNERILCATNEVKYWETERLFYVHNSMF